MTGAQDLGEVFTPEGIVSEMLVNLEEVLATAGSKVLEPACGNGNFLVAVFGSKISGIRSLELGLEDSEYRLVEALSSIYAVDISEENVLDARARLESMSIAFLNEIGSKQQESLILSIRTVLESNILQGDSLLEADKILFIEYQPIGKRAFSREYFYLEDPEIDLFYVAPDPLEPKSYLDLGRDQR